MKNLPTTRRKLDHIQISLNHDVASAFSTGLEKYHFQHQALPEIDLDDIDPSFTLLGKKISFPLLISSMTGGTPEAYKINRNLAIAAGRMEVGFAVGSQRAAIENPAMVKTYRFRDFAPDIPVFANLGAIQLNYSYGLDECQRAVEMIKADGLILHLNPLQEALQPEGETRFKGLVIKIESVCRKLTVPVIIKEVGFGISTQTAKMLSEAGVWAVDVAGSGGTSWSQVESYRANSLQDAQVAEAFRDWGISTADSIELVKQAAPKLKVFASGGLRSGVDMAKCIALGAEMCGIALPFLRVAKDSEEAVEKLIKTYLKQFRITMFAVGVSNLQALAKTKLIKE